MRIRSGPSGETSPKLRSVSGRPSYNPNKSGDGPTGCTAITRFRIRARKRIGIEATARSTIASNALGAIRRGTLSE